jgi:hypothetical protein
MSHQLQEHYKKEIAPALQKALGVDNVMEIPRITKVVVNIGVGEALDNAKALDAAVGDLTKIVGQKPVITWTAWSTLPCHACVTSVVFPRMHSMVAAITPWVCANNSSSPRSSMTKLINYAAWKSRS